MSRKDVKRLSERGLTFTGYNTEEINGFLYRLGLSNNGSGILTKDDLNGHPVLVLECGKIMLYVGKDNHVECDMAESDWAVVKSAYEENVRLFFVIRIERDDTDPLRLRVFKNRAHVVALEVIRNKRWYLHDLLITDHELYDELILPCIEEFRQHAFQSIKGRLDSENLKIHLQYNQTPRLHIQRSCAIHVLWIIQEALKGRHMPSLTSNPNLQLLFLEKILHVQQGSDGDIDEWQLKPLDWKYDCIIDELVKNSRMTWKRVEMRKQEVDNQLAKDSAPTDCQQMLHC